MGFEVQPARVFGSMVLGFRVPTPPRASSLTTDHETLNLPQAPIPGSLNPVLNARRLRMLILHRKRQWYDLSSAVS